MLQLCTHVEQHANSVLHNFVQTSSTCVLYCNKSRLDPCSCAAVATLYAMYCCLLLPPPCVVACCCCCNVRAHSGTVRVSTRSSWQLQLKLPSTYKSASTSVRRSRMASARAQQETLPQAHVGGHSVPGTWGAVGRSSWRSMMKRLAACVRQGCRTWHHSL